MSEYPIHPAAELFPMMGEAELRELAEDIRANGLLERIVLHDGQILDGRNRLAACRIADVEPLYENPNGAITSPVAYVLSKNLHRRQLTVSQRAAIGAEAIPLLHQEAKKRMGMRTDLTSVPKETEVGRSREIAAEQVGVSPQSIQRAANVRRESPEMFEMVKRGEVTVTAANDAIRQPKTDPTKYEAVTPRQQQVANAQKRKMIDGISLVSGVCHGLESVSVAAIVAVSEAEEIETWATKAEAYARELRKFAARLRGTNGKSE